MGFVNAIFLIILGALCIPSLIAQKSPNAKQILDKIVPFQGIYGIICLIWGIWILIQCILSLGWFGLGILWLICWITWLGNAILNIAGGAILGWGMIQKSLLAKASDDVKAKAEGSFAKLVAFQPKIGVFAIIFGIWVIVLEILLIIF